jgi:hypothetical protein
VCLPSSLHLSRTRHADPAAEPLTAVALLRLRCTVTSVYPMLMCNFSLLAAQILLLSLLTAVALLSVYSSYLIFRQTRQRT